MVRTQLNPYLLVSTATINILQCREYPLDISQHQKLSIPDSPHPRSQPLGKPSQKSTDHPHRWILNTGKGVSRSQQLLHDGFESISKSEGRVQ